MKQPLKSITDFGPLVLFFAAYKLEGIIAATAALIVSTLIVLAITYYLTRHIPIMPLITAAVVSIFGSITIFSGNDLFIKIKPTIINIIFATILIIGLLKGKGLLKYLFDSTIKMPDSAWKVFSLRWALFFIFIAAANEYVWRNFSTDTWVDFKVFGLLGVTFVFILTQIPFLHKNMSNDTKKED
jgi:intracellular septation protein